MAAIHEPTDGPESSVTALAAVFDELQRELAALPDADAVLGRITAVAVERINGAEYAGVTVLDGVSLRTKAPTGPLVARVDALQLKLQSGPCMDAAREDTVHNSADLRTDARWPAFGPRAFAATGVVSMLSVRLHLDDSPPQYAMNLYSTRPAAFDATAQSVGVLLATHGALALAHAAARTRSTHLTIALDNARDIGIALGVLMNSLRVTREQAFDLLKVVSQHEQRKLADVAKDVRDTGVLPGPPLA